MLRASTVNLYRRHLSTCRVHTIKKITAAVKRHFMDCDCPIWIVGRTETGIVPRQSTGTNELPIAEAFRKSLVSAGVDQQVRGPLITDCINEFIASEKHAWCERVQVNYRFQFDRFAAFCEDRGVHHMQELSVNLLEEFKVKGLPVDMADTTKGIAFSKVRHFLSKAFGREWIKKPLAQATSSHAGEYEQKDPYSGRELELILAEAAKLNGGRIGYASQPKTFCLLLRLMVETGMRVSDAIRYDPSAPERGESGLWIYSFTPKKQRRTKQKKVIEAYLPHDLKTAIDKCVWLSPAKPFWYGSPTAGYGLGYQVYDRMKTIGSRCGIEDCRPHRLRDTFAVNALQRGVPLEDVSRLLGHSSIKVTERYYAKWVPARKRRLEDTVAKSLVNKSRAAFRNR